MMMKVIQGRDGLYIMQRAWHSDTDPRPKGVAGVDPDTEWKAFFAGVEVCDSRVPGRLPCPAVTTPPASPAPAVAAAPARPNPGQAPAPAAPSSGTGFVVNKAGFVVTNNHVVDKCQTIQARQPSDTPVSATLVAADPRNDLALLKLAQPKYGAAPFRQDRAVRPGDSVVAYGFPLAGGLSSQGNLTIGTISALAGLGDDSRMLQVTVPVQPGNSGGPLLDAAGNIVGVVTSKLNALAVALVTGDVPQNVNFAIKDSVVRTFLESNGIAFETAASARRLDPADVGDRAKKFTVQIECRR
jgi:S1-C subfamily serine protease